MKSSQDIYDFSEIKAKLLQTVEKIKAAELSKTPEEILAESAERESVKAYELIAGFKKAGFPDHFRGASFDNFIFDCPNSYKALSVMKKMAGNFEDSLRRWRPILIYGKEGVGKTHLAISLGQELLAQDIKIKYVRVNDLLRRLKDSRRFRCPETESQVIDDVTNCRVLILDEIGAPLADKADFDSMLYAMDAVVSRLYDDNRALILVSNLKPETEGETLGIDHFVGFRAFSRLQQNAVRICCAWPSWRAK
jgi:DNA replication protein DnaC